MSPLINVFNNFITINDVTLNSCGIFNLKIQISILSSPWIFSQFTDIIGLYVQEERLHSPCGFVSDFCKQITKRMKNRRFYTVLNISRYPKKITKSPSLASPFSYLCSLYLYRVSQKSLNRLDMNKIIHIRMITFFSNQKHLYW